MTQEEKQLLLKDLCVRLPYGVKFLRESWNFEWDQEMSVIEVLENIDKDGYINHTMIYRVEDIKPYLRPLSSMTEEEKNEFHKLRFIHVNYGLEPLQCVLSVNEIDWLNAHHFDYRGLIEKGLAIAVTKENNPYEN